MAPSIQGPGSLDRQLVLYHFAPIAKTAPATRDPLRVASALDGIIAVFVAVLGTSRKIMCSFRQI